MKKTIGATLLLLALPLIMAANEREENSRVDKTLSTNEMSQSNSKTDLLRIVPPSPETRALFRYVDHPVSNSMGIPDITIPIYTIEAGPITLPISISYHAGGRKVDDVTGAVGLGWTLNAGGMAARTIVGKCDFKNSVSTNIKTAYQLDSIRNSYVRPGYDMVDGVAAEYKYLTDMYYDVTSGPANFSGSSYNSEYDIFSFSTTNASGKFVLHGDKAKLIASDPVSAFASRENISITEDTGIQYSFKCKGTPYTDYYLEKIISPDGKYTIEITNKGAALGQGNTNSTYQIKMPMHTMEVTDEVFINSMGTNVNYRSYSPIYQYHNGKIDYDCQRISEIKFPGGKMLFDIEEIGGKVNRITVQNAQGRTIKTVLFTYSQLDFTGQYNYKLDKLEIMDGDKPGETYKFEYNPSKNFGHTCCDFWGYKNRNEGVTTERMFPGFLIDAMGRPGGMYIGTGAGNTYREPDFQRVQDGVLHTIIYPTGGKTEFTYELNKVTIGNKVMDGPGIRIKSIKTDGGNGKIITKTYEYPSSGSIAYFYPLDAAGHPQIFLDYTGNRSYPRNQIYKGFKRTRTFYSLLQNDLGEFAYQPICYTSVIEYIGEGEQLSGKTVYRYNNPYSQVSINPYPSPKGLSGFGLVPNIPFDYSTAARYVSPGSFYWKKRSLNLKEDYKYTGSDYEIVKQTSYVYTSKNEEVLRGLRIFRYMNFKDSQSEVAGAILNRWSVFSYGDYYIRCGIDLLTQISETEYRNGNIIKTSQIFTYNDYNIVNSITMVNSDGTSTSKTIKYPFDDIYKNNAPYNKMVNRHMLRYPVSETTSVQGNGNKETFTYQYKEWEPNQILPECIHHTIGLNAGKEKIRYHLYDSYGNPLHVSVDGILHIVYLWGYEGKYPIAEIKNATYSTVETLLGQETINRMARSSTPTLSDIYALNSLRNNERLKDALITTYTYSTLIGVTSVTLPNGLKTSYEYDRLGRLSQIRDHKGHLIEEYNYNYKQ